MATTLQNSATVRDESNNIMSVVTVVWTSLNTAVATVSSTGLITAVAAGTCVVKASCGGVEAACLVTVT